MDRRIHKSSSDIATKCGLNVFNFPRGLHMSERWKDVDCEECLKHKPKKPSQNSEAKK